MKTLLLNVSAVILDTNVTCKDELICKLSLSLYDREFSPIRSEYIYQSIPKQEMDNLVSEYNLIEKHSLEALYVTGKPDKQEIRTVYASPILKNIFKARKGNKYAVEMLNEHKDHNIIMMGLDIGIQSAFLARFNPEVSDMCVKPRINLSDVNLRDNPMIGENDWNKAALTTKAYVKKQMGVLGY